MFLSTVGSVKETFIGRYDNGHVKSQYIQDTYTEYADMG